MRKLNEKGWGLGVFIAFILVFCIAILIITIQADRMGIGTSDNTDLHTTENSITTDEKN